jgi:hypothetical protein
VRGTYAVLFAWGDEPPEMGCLELMDDGFALESGLGRDRIFRFQEIASARRMKDADRLRGCETVLLGFPSGSRLRIGLMGLGAPAEVMVALGERVDAESTRPV